MNTQDNSAHVEGSDIKSEEQGEDVKCPFCGMDGFDKVGFKDHLTWCDEYKKTEIL